MKITRKTMITVKTVRQLYERQTAETVFCERCGEQMIPAQMSADFFGISSRVIYRLIEAGELHFVETGTRDIYVCPNSMRTILQTK